MKGKKIILEDVDTVVVAAGSRPVNTLEPELNEIGVPVKVIGDSKKVRNALAAIYEGYLQVLKYILAFLPYNSVP